MISQDRLWRYTWKPEDLIFLKDKNESIEDAEKRIKELKKKGMVENLKLKDAGKRTRL